MRVIQQIREILAKEMAIRSLVYSSNFFNDINGDRSLLAPENCQHDLVYGQLLSEPFVCKKVRLFTLQRLGIDNSQTCGHILPLSDVCPVRYLTLEGSYF